MSEIALPAWLQHKWLGMAPADWLQRHDADPLGWASRWCRQADGPVRAEGEIDRIYRSVPGPLLLEAPDHGQAAGRSLEIRHSGFEDVVVWNPAQEKCAGLADMPPDGWRQMLCVEAAQVFDPITLPPDGFWEAWQQLQVLTP